VPSDDGWLLLRAPKELEDVERRYLHQLRRVCPAVWQVQALAQAFGRLVRSHDQTAQAPDVRTGEVRSALRQLTFHSRTQQECRRTHSTVSKSTTESAWNQA
jgi:hypothetical protein